MPKALFLKPTLAAMLAAAAPALAQEWTELAEPIVVPAEAAKWEPVPSLLPEGAEIAHLEGDLARAEPHAFLLRMPSGYRVPPHSHPMREHVTVLSGELMMGMGEEFDESAATALGPASFFALPVGDTHYVWAEGETVLLLHGIGPWGITYADPAEDPRNR